MDAVSESGAHSPLRLRMSSENLSSETAHSETNEIEINDLLQEALFAKSKSDLQGMLRICDKIISILESTDLIVNITIDDVHVVSMFIISAFDPTNLDFTLVLLRFLHAFQKRERTISDMIPDEFVICCLALMQEAELLRAPLIDVITEFVIIKEHLLSMIFDTVLALIPVDESDLSQRIVHFFHVLLASYPSCDERYVQSIALTLITNAKSHFSEIPFIMHEFWNRNFSLLRLPGGVQFYNNLLTLDGSCLYEVLCDIKSCLVRDDDLIQIISSGLDMQRIVNLITDSNELIAETSIVLCNNFISHGGRFCSELIAIGLIDRLLQVIRFGSWELKRQGILCLSVVLSMQDSYEIISRIITSPDILNLFAEILENLSDTQLAVVASSLHHALVLLQRGMCSESIAQLVHSSNLCSSVWGLCERTFTSQSAESAILALAAFFQEQ